ncbi:uncharacterized protein LOC119111589 [Pollicipes pollicipes]|uniref:uncharacterized protein LOC119111589 n=1 Tax=Pollicipes pollicipes TaxID=41117 RepID=UPI001884DAD4|nr:uncharacterized protein LOC119111589 [Pollicipes pollicipes]
MEKILRFGRMVFIYDTECCQHEADDPTEAICFLHPGEEDEEEAGAVRSDALHLVCQLMGTALFAERNMASLPVRIRLHHGEFVLHREGRFIWAMHTSSEDETYVTRRQLAMARQVLQLLHGGLAELLASAADRAALRRRLRRTLCPLMTGTRPRPPLERIFDALPRLDWAKKDDFIGQQLSEVQTAASAVAGVLACIVCWDGQVISSEYIEEIAQVLVFIHWLPEDAFALVDVDFVLPPATMLAAVHVPSQAYRTLQKKAEPMWKNSGPRAKRASLPTASSDVAPLDVIEERPEGVAEAARHTASHSSSTQDGADVRGIRPNGGRRRRRRAAALSAECARAEPTAPPRVDDIPVRRLRRLPRQRSSRPRRSLSDLDVPEPFSNLAYLKCKQPDLYRDELRKLQARLRDNQPTFTAVPANPYSFGIPRSNRLYTPRPGGAPAPRTSPLPSLGRTLSWRPWRADGAGYASESARPVGLARGPRRRFFSDGEEGGWRPRQLAQLVSEVGQCSPAAPQPQPPHRTTPATLYVKVCGKLKCYVIVEQDKEILRDVVEVLERTTGRGLQELECMLRSYRTIPSFHGQHYSYAACKPYAGGRSVETEGAAYLDGRLLQMVHADLVADRLTDCRIRTPTDVLLAERSGQLETYYQQQTSGHQHGLPVVNGPLSRLGDRARKRLGKNHGLMLG